jgi:hypothetical protein
MKQISILKVDPTLYRARNGPLDERQRHAEISQIEGAITGAGLLNGVRYSTGEKRAMCLRVAGEMLARSVGSFDDLADAELRGVVATLVRQKHTVAEWLRGQHELPSV